MTQTVILHNHYAGLQLAWKTLTQEEFSGEVINCFLGFLFSQQSALRDSDSYDDHSEMNIDLCYDTYIVFKTAV